MWGIAILILVLNTVFCILNFIVAEENNVISEIDNFVSNKDIVPVEEKLYLLLNKCSSFRPLLRMTFMSQVPCVEENTEIEVTFPFSNYMLWFSVCN